jgi:hypothetical protein
MSASSRMGSLVIFVFLTLNLINTDNHQFCGSRKKKESNGPENNAFACRCRRGCPWSLAPGPLVLATVCGRLHHLSPCRARSSRGAPSLAMEAARAELAQPPWRRLGRSSSADHGGDSCRARRPTMEAAHEELALHRPSPRKCGSQLLCISVLLGLSLRRSGLRGTAAPRPVVVNRV